MSCKLPDKKGQRSVKLLEGAQGGLEGDCSWCERGGVGGLEKMQNITHNRCKMSDAASYSSQYIKVVPPPPPPGGGGGGASSTHVSQTMHSEMPQSIDTASCDRAVIVQARGVLLQASCSNKSAQMLGTPLLPGSMRSMRGACVPAC